MHFARQPSFLQECWNRVERTRLQPPNAVEIIGVFFVLAPLKKVIHIRQPLAHTLPKISKNMSKMVARGHKKTTNCSQEPPQTNGFTKKRKGPMSLTPFSRFLPKLVRPRAPQGSPKPSKNHQKWSASAPEWTAWVEDWTWNMPGTCRRVWALWDGSMMAVYSVPRGSHLPSKIRKCAQAAPGRSLLHTLRDYLGA